MTKRALRVLVVSLAWVMCLTLVTFGAAAAQAAEPVITTPTPPIPATSTPMPFFQILRQTPESERQGSLVFLPLLTADGGNRINEPHSFEYGVQPGDTLWSLALDFGRDLNTMSCTTTPTGADAESLLPGQIITVPALDDVCYTVTPGDTLAGIAARFGLTVESIVAVPWNGFTNPPFVVRLRQRVLLPGVRPAAQPRPDHRSISYAADSWAATFYTDWPFGDGEFIWPVDGPISQYARPGHWALDIAAPIGTPINAVDRGTVVQAGWNPNGYGFRVVIDHGIDYVTLYAHLSDIYVEVGQIVGKGQIIGVSGSNGNITGPHLHFEIRDFGYLTDPMKLLPTQ